MRSVERGDRRTSEASSAATGGRAKRRTRRPADERSFQRGDRSLRLPVPRAPTVGDFPTRAGSLYPTAPPSDSRYRSFGYRSRQPRVSGSALHPPHGPAPGSARRFRAGIFGRPELVRRVRWREGRGRDRRGPVSYARRVSFVGIRRFRGRQRTSSTRPSRPQASSMGMRMWSRAVTATSTMAVGPKGPGARTPDPPARMNVVISSGVSPP